jgi:serine protease Do
MNKGNTYLVLGLSFLSALMIVSAGLVYHLYREHESLRRNITELGKKITPEDFLSPQETKDVEKIVEKINDPWSDLQSKLKDTVVQVFSLISEFNWIEPYKTPNQGQAFGTGFFINDKGYIITNAHVVNQISVAYIQIPSLGKQQFEVEIVCFNPDRDLALLRVKPDELEKVKEQLGGEVPYLKLGDSNNIRRGAEIMTLGYPLGQQGLKSTTGVVSGRETVNRHGQYIQIDAPINPGNSGGPSVNTRGEVIGINAAKISDAENVGYIIPVNELKLILKDMFKCDGELMRRPFLGVFYNASNPIALTEYLGNPSSGGLYITAIFKGGVLDKVGVRPGDMLYEINGYKIDQFGEIPYFTEDKISLSDYTAYLALDQDVTLVLYRDGQKLNFKFKFEQSELPPVRVKYPPYDKIDYEVVGGMVVMEFARNLLPLLLQADPDLIIYEDFKNQLEPFIVVTHVIPGSPIHRTRVISAGTRISEVNGKNVKTLDEFRDALRKSIKTNYLTLKSMKDVFTVCKFDSIVAQEPRLASMYRYPISPYIKSLFEEYAKEYEKKTGSDSSGKAATA